MDQPYGDYGDHFGCGVPCHCHQPRGEAQSDRGIRWRRSLQAQLDQEKERAEDLEEYKVYVKTKQYAEEVAKERLGLVNPDEILLKPEDEN